jgi:hypothetical protein
MNFQIQRKDFHSFIVDRCKNVSIKTPTLEISFNARIASVVKDYESNVYINPKLHHNFISKVHHFRSEG